VKVLCAVDFTPRDQAAAQVAVDLAGRTGGAVELIHVTGPRMADLLARAASTTVLDGEVRADINARLASECDRIARAGVQVSAHLCEGEVEPAILKRAQKIGADLIVVGAHGRSALRRFLFGSVGDEAVSIANRPILVVPPDVEQLRSTDDGARRLRVTVALDGRSGGAAAIAFARELRSQTPCDLTFLRLYWAMEEYDRLGLAGPRDPFEPDADVVADLEREVRSAVAFLPGTGDTSVVVEPAWGELADKILEVARRQDDDLLIVGAESRHGLSRIKHPAVATRIAHLASGIPVVFVPHKEGSAPGKSVPAIMNVLAPTDLSREGNRAIAFAYGMVAAQGGVVDLCYVHERTDGRLTPDERERIEGRLRALIPRDAEERGITTHITVVEGGGAAEAIVQAAERLVVDAIVMASHGEGGALRSILGSVSHAVVDRSRRPVSIIPSLER
jgi:nucleotide-binding universal stress UspA family protein